MDPKTAITFSALAIAAVTMLFALGPLIVNQASAYGRYDVKVVVYVGYHHHPHHHHYHHYYGRGGYGGGYGPSEGGYGGGY